jgi:glutathione S-transferase
MHASFSALRSEMSFNVGLRVELSSVSEQLSADLKRIDELWTEGLRTFGGPFLAGKEFGAVDAFYAPVVVRVQTFVGAVDFLGDEARGYMRTILAMPEMKEWTDAALRESWREGAHEEDTTLGRRIVEDLRTGVEAV